MAVNLAGHILDMICKFFIYLSRADFLTVAVILRIVIEVLVLCNNLYYRKRLDTLGILFMIAGLVVARGFQVVSLKMVIVVLFLWLTSPVSSHLIGRLEMTVNDHLDQEMTVQDPVQIEKERES